MEAWGLAPFEASWRGRGSSGEKVVQREVTPSKVLSYFYRTGSFSRDQNRVPRVIAQGLIGCGIHKSTTAS